MTGFGSASNPVIASGVGSPLFCNNLFKVSGYGTNTALAQNIPRMLEWCNMYNKCKVYAWRIKIKCKNILNTPAYLWCYQSPNSQPAFNAGTGGAVVNPPFTSTQTMINYAHSNPRYLRTKFMRGSPQGAGNITAFWSAGNIIQDKKRFNADNSYEIDLSAGSAPTITGNSLVLWYGCASAFNTIPIVAFQPMDVQLELFTLFYNPDLEAM